MNKLLRSTLPAFLVVGFIVAPIDSFAGGATVLHDNWNSSKFCSEPQPDGTVCMEVSKAVWTLVVTPSNNSNFSMKGTLTQTFTNAMGTLSTTQDERQKVLIKNGFPQVDRLFSEFQLTINGACVLQTVEYDFQYVNGSVSYANPSWTRSPC